MRELNETVKVVGLEHATVEIREGQPGTARYTRREPRVRVRLEGAGLEAKLLVDPSIAPKINDEMTITVHFGAWADA